MDWLHALPGWLEILVLIGAALSALAIIWRYVIKPAKAFLNEVSAGMRSLNGYDEVLDPGSGTVLKESTPPLARRVEQVEQAIILLTDTNLRLLELERQHADHIAWSQGWVAAIEARLGVLETPHPDV